MALLIALIIPFSQIRIGNPRHRGVGQDKRLHQTVQPLSQLLGRFRLEYHEARAAERGEKQCAGGGRENPWFHGYALYAAVFARGS